MRKARVWAFLLALLIVVCVPAAYAEQTEGENDPYVATIYNERNGLPTGEANAILQTSDGYIWVGSYGGLIRYDGSNFRNYSTEGKLPSASVRSLFEDSNGRLWIGTNDAGVFYMENDEIIPVENPTDNTFLIIRDFVEGFSETIYVTSNTGMAMIHGGVLTPCRGERINSETVYTVGLDSHGRAWGRLNAGLCAVVQDGEVVRIFSSEDFFDNGDEIACASSDAKGNIYLGSSGTGILRVSFPTDTLEVSDMVVEHIDTEGITAPNKIIVSDDGRVVVCGSNGICVIEADGTALSFNEADSAAAVNDAIIDYEGNIWIASTSSGTVKYSKGCFQTPKNTGLEDVAVNAFVKQLDGYYIATDSGVYAFDADWNPVENAYTDFYGDVRVRSLMADSTGHVWVASYDPVNSVGCYDPATDTMTTFGPEDGIISTKVRSLLEMSDGRIVTGTQEGFNVIENGQVVQSIGVSDGLEAASTLCLLESYDGHILAGSDGQGIYEVDGDTVINHGFNEGLQEGAVLRMLADPEGGGYFVSAGDSLYYWDGSSYERLSNLQKGMGGIFDLYLHNDKLWILQNSGIRSFDRAALLAGKSEAPTVYSFAYGLPGSINANTWNCLDESGALHMSTRSGVTIFRFREITGSLPKGIINSVTVDDTVHANPAELELDPSARRVTFDFSALAFTDTTQVGISYWLEGFDEGEITTLGEKNGSISYTNLAGGDYNFHLSIFNPSDTTERNDYTLPIVKPKTIMERPLLVGGLAALALLIIAGIVALVISRRLRNAKMLQTRYRKIIDESLLTLSNVVDAKDPHTKGHSRRVAYYANELAKRMGKSVEDQERIYCAALLHDIGKTGIPTAITSKTEPLTEEELAVMRTHTTVGGELLRNFTSIQCVADGARYHHERYDGTGYAEHKRGDEIPEVARIIRVADSYDIMRSGRLHREGLSKEAIIEEFQRKSGSKFDPELVSLVLDMIRDGYNPPE